MTRTFRSALLMFVLAGLAGGVVAGCSKADEHADHEHKPGEKHEDHK